jgi:hypothetical protein
MCREAGPRGGKPGDAERADSEFQAGVALVAKAFAAGAHISTAYSMARTTRKVPASVFAVRDF